MFSRLVVLLALVASIPSSAAANPTEAQRLVYQGRLVDDSGRPVTGVFPLTFNLYANAKARRASWSEAGFVAVDNGVYAYELGRTKALPRNFQIDKGEIGVAITGQKKELVREALAGSTRSEAREEVKPTFRPVAGVKPSSGSQQTYADLAGFAYEAERAKVADRIGGLTEADLRELAKSATSQPAAPAPKARIGSEKRSTQSAGGPDGSPYSLSCPPGFVVTGIRGGSGALVDSIALVCSPLE